MNDRNRANVIVNVRYNILDSKNIYDAVIVLWNSRIYSTIIIRTNAYLIASTDSDSHIKQIFFLNFKCSFRTMKDTCISVNSSGHVRVCHVSKREL